MAINDGGPAHPQTLTENYRQEMLSPEQSGMTLRDYFAANADVGNIDEWSDEFITQMSGIPKPKGDYDAVAFAIRSTKAESRIRFIYADAMIAARQVGE